MKRFAIIILLSIIGGSAMATDGGNTRSRLSTVSPQELEPSRRTREATPNELYYQSDRGRELVKIREAIMSGRIEEAEALHRQFREKYYGGGSTQDAPPMRQPKLIGPSSRNSK